MNAQGIIRYRLLPICLCAAALTMFLLHQPPFAFLFLLVAVVLLQELFPKTEKEEASSSARKWRWALRGLAAALLLGALYSGRHFLAECVALWKQFLTKKV